MVRIQNCRIRISLNLFMSVASPTRISNFYKRKIGMDRIFFLISSIFKILFDEGIIFVNRQDVRTACVGASLILN